MQVSLNKLNIGKSAKYLGVSVDTLRRWEKRGYIKSHRSPGGHRYFLIDDLRLLMKQKHKKYIKQDYIKSSSDKIHLTNPHNSIYPIENKNGEHIKTRSSDILIILFLLFLILDIVLTALYFYFR